MIGLYDFNLAYLLGVAIFANVVFYVLDYFLIKYKKRFFVKTNK